jgi:hypothetical protein
MAIVKFVAAKRTIRNALNYITNPEKTNETLVSGVNCTPESAESEFDFTKTKFNKHGGREYYHIVQSFSPDDNITPEIAHEIGIKFAEYFKGYQIVISTHCDKDHIHNHMIMNSVNYKTGKKFHQTKEDLMRVKEFSNKLCLEYGLSQTEVKSDWKEMPKWKSKLRNDAYYAAKVSRTKEEFIRFMESRGYKVKWEDGHKYITFTTPDGKKCRDNKLFAEQLLRENLEIYFALGGCDSGLAEQYAEYSTPVKDNVGYTFGNGLFTLLKNLLESVPHEMQYVPPIERGELDKMTVMELEALGIKVEPKAFVYYSANEPYEEERMGFYL